MTNITSTDIEFHEVMGHRKSIKPASHELVEAVTWTEADAIATALELFASDLAGDPASQAYATYLRNIAQKFEGVLNEITLQRGIY